MTASAQIADLSHIFCILLIFALTVLQGNAYIHSHFGYKQMGADWKDICSHGQLQVPFNIEANKAQCDNSISLSYVFNRTKQSIEILYSYTLKSYFHYGELYATDVNGLRLGYDALEFHIHGPSENTMDGRYYEAEVHFVHKLKPEYEKLTTNRYAVIALFMEVDYEDNYRATFLDDWNIKELDGHFDFDLKRALDRAGVSFESEFITFKGSLTTPPCSELVNWYVLKRPAYMTHQAQAVILNSYFKNNQTFANFNGNNRLLQKSNNRVMKTGNAWCFLNSQ